MGQHVWLVSSLFALLVALFYRPDLILVCVVVLLTLGCSALALSVIAQWYFDRKPTAPSNVNSPSRRELEALKRFMQELLPHSTGQGGRRLPVIFGRTLDDILQKLIDLTLRDFVQSWLQESGFGNTDQIVKEIKADLWKVISRLQERAARVDLAQLIAVEMISKVTSHFERLRLLHMNNPNDFSISSPYYNKPGHHENSSFLRKKSFLIPLGFHGGALFFSAFNTLPARFRSEVLNSASINQTPEKEINENTLDNLHSSPEAERIYLRKVAELCLMFLFSPEYMTLDPVRHLLRELLVCKVFQPCIESLTDPDSINRKLLAYIEQQAAASAAAAAEAGNGGRSPIADGYTPATSFEDLLIMIKQCQDIQVLKHIRYNIVTEIMQATASGGGSATRRYLARLSQAQARCEARLQDLGEGQDFRNGRKSPRKTNGAIEEAAEAMHNSKRLIGSPMVNLLSSPEARIFLSEYLDSQHTDGEAGRQMLAYWEATETLKAAIPEEKHQLATGIFYTYVNAPNSAVLVEKGIRKRMESFLLGDGGPEAFFEVENQVIANLEAKYWHGFSTSSQYIAMQSSLAERAQEASETAFNDDADDTTEYSKTTNDAPIQARTQLGRLQEKLNNKIQALRALSTSLKPDSRVLSDLEEEVHTIKGELTQLKAHLSRTDLWSEHLGRWKAVVQSTEISGEELQFVIVVHVAEDDTDKEAVSTGWVVLRKLHHFLQLHRKLCQVNSAVKSFELPSAPLKFRLTTKLNPANLDKATNQIQKYLKFVLEDDKLNASEALYGFLSPSSDNLKYGENVTDNDINSSESKRNKKFSLATLFKVQELRDAFMTGSGGGGEENASLLIEPTQAISSGILDGKDAIAEPLYSLLGEIFDLRGVFKWLRKTLITFVQITYGRTINRQVRETIAWLVSESMAYYYVQTIIKTWWPVGKLIQPENTRTDLQKEQTRSEARKQFLNNVPELLSSLVGQQNARRGAIKVFESLQHSEYNKHLFYQLLDVMLTEIFPETKMD